jgi:hypothetical protein
MHPGVLAEQTEELEAYGLAGVFFAGMDVEGGRKGSLCEAVGVKGPEGEQVELFGGTREILAVEIGELIDEGLGGLIGFHKISSG